MIGAGPGDLQQHQPPERLAGPAHEALDHAQGILTDQTVDDPHRRASQRLRIVGAWKGHTQGLKVRVQPACPVISGASQPHIAFVEHRGFRLDHAPGRDLHQVPLGQPVHGAPDGFERQAQGSGDGVDRDRPAQVVGGRPIEGGVSPLQTGVLRDRRHAGGRHQRDHQRVQPTVYLVPSHLDHVKQVDERHAHQPPGTFPIVIVRLDALIRPHLRTVLHGPWPWQPGSHRFSRPEPHSAEAGTWSRRTSCGKRPQ